MPLIECTECGKRGRTQDPVCWNCRHPRDVVEAPPVRHGSAPVPAPTGAEHRNWRLGQALMGGLWFLALWLVFRLASPEGARAQYWAWTGAIPALASFEAEHERLRADHETAQDVYRFLRELER